MNRKSSSFKRILPRPVVSNAGDKGDYITGPLQNQLQTTHCLPDRYSDSLYPHGIISYSQGGPVAYYNPAVTCYNPEYHTEITYPSTGQESSSNLMEEELHVSGAYLCFLLF